MNDLHYVYRWCSSKRQWAERNANADATLILATDCDREGQLIGQEILEHLNYRGIVQRALFTAQNLSRCSSLPRTLYSMTWNASGVALPLKKTRHVGFRSRAIIARCRIMRGGIELPSRVSAGQDPQCPRPAPGDRGPSPVDRRCTARHSHPAAACPPARRAGRNRPAAGLPAQA